MMIFGRASSISLLDASRRPSTIFGIVVSIIVNSIKSQAIGSFSHIFEKCKKVIFPRIAHGYSSGSVIFILRSLWVVASLNHSSPSKVLWPAFSWTRRAVNESRVVFTEFCCEAATSFNFPSIQVCGASYDASSAIAFTFPPICIVTNFSRLFDNYESRKSKADQIRSFVHEDIVPNNDGVTQ